MSKLLSFPSDLSNAHFTHVCVHVHMPVWVCVCVGICVCTHVCFCVCACFCICVCVCVCVSTSSLIVINSKWKKVRAELHVLAFKICTVFFFFFLFFFFLFFFAFSWQMLSKAWVSLTNSFCSLGRWHQRPHYEDTLLGIECSLEIWSWHWLG